LKVIIRNGEDVSALVVAVEEEELSGADSDFSVSCIRESVLIPSLGGSVAGHLEIYGHVLVTLGSLRAGAILRLVAGCDCEERERCDEKFTFHLF
jgi:hypothetical protein